MKSARVRRQKQREPTMTKHFPDMLTSNTKLIVPMADPDLELRGRGGGGGQFFVPCPTDYFFIQNKEGWPSPRSATECLNLILKSDGQQTIIILPLTKNNMAQRKIATYRRFINKNGVDLLSIVILSSIKCEQSQTNFSKFPIKNTSPYFHRASLAI